MKKCDLICKKQILEKKKKNKVKKKGKKIMLQNLIAFIIIFTIATILLIVSWKMNPIFNDDNTVSVTGVITSVEKESRLTGYKSRQRTWVIIELDNGNHYEVQYKFFRENGWEYDSLKNELMNKDVSGRCSANDPYKLVSLSTQTNTILNYDVFNQSRNSGSVAVILVYIFALAFSGLWIWLKSSK